MRVFAMAEDARTAVEEAEATVVQGGCGVCANTLRSVAKDASVGAEVESRVVVDATVELKTM